MHEMASLVMFWVENSLMKTLICVGRYSVRPKPNSSTFKDRGSPDRATAAGVGY